jgi:O-antigen ligase/tetratricopeptide (TPR) repeat protein
LDTDLRRQSAAVVRQGIHLGVLLLVVLSPWALGGAEPVFEFLLNAGLGILLLLWGLRVLLEGRFTWKKCPVALCLALLFGLGCLHVAPLPRPLLRWLSPATAQAYDEFLPAQQERLPGAEAWEPPATPTGATLSLYPGVTEREQLRLLAVLLLFLVVRNNIPPARGLRWLSAAALGNGAVLALFGLVQFATCPRSRGSFHWLYWTYQVPGTVFGPFVYQNAYVCYLDLCVGLGLGLLPAWLYLSRDRASGGAGGRPPLSGLVTDPRLLWVSLSLILMLASVLATQCRAGLLVLLTAAVVLVPLWQWRASAGSWLKGAALLLLLGAGPALAAWLSPDLARSRFQTVWTGEFLQDGRLEVWSRAWALAQQFPVWGTGSGTYPYVDLPRQTVPNGPVDFRIWDHAHNEYLEALVEGGLVRLVLILAAIGLVFARGRQALARQQSPAVRGLVLGGLFAFTTLVAHSVVDYGIHLPAVAVLAAVLCAHLAGLGKGAALAEGSGEAPAPEEGELSLRCRGLAPLAAAATLVLLGSLLGGESWRAYRAQRLLERGLGLTAAGEPAGGEGAIRALRAATSLVPRSARLHVYLGDAYLREYEREAAKVRAERQRHHRLAAFLAGLPPPGWPLTAGPGATVLGCWGWVPRAPREQEAPEVLDPALVPEAGRRHLNAALAEYLTARDLCPLLAGPQARLAAYQGWLRQADPRGAYLDRACRLAPYDADLWYAAGLEQLRAGRPDRAWRSWRHALEWSDRYLGPIVHESARVLGPGEIARNVLPDSPAQLLAAAACLYPGPDDTPGRRPFAEKAVAALARQPGPPTARNLHLLGRARAFLGQPAAALTAYEAALAKRPGELSWNVEYAQLLGRHGRAPEARRRLSAVLRRQPTHAAARQLLEQLSGGPEVRPARAPR